MMEEGFFVAFAGILNSIGSFPGELTVRNPGRNGKYEVVGQSGVILKE
jgi:hypothetical protein